MVGLSGDRPGSAWGRGLAFTLVGALSVFPGWALYALAADLGLGPGSNLAQNLLFVWFVNAPVEELAKYLCFALAATWGRTLRRPHDGVIQGAATGLGFGLVENLLYGVDGGFQVLLLRALVSLPGHVLYGAVWGGYHGFDVYQGRGRLQRPWVPLLALVPAAFFHALFNTLAWVGAPLALTLASDLLALSLGVFLYTRLWALRPEGRRRPLRDWALAIPELEHALALDPRARGLPIRLAAYLLAAGRADEALERLRGLEADPWARFYADAARVRLGQLAASPPPASAARNPALFQRLSTP